MNGKTNSPFEYFLYDNFTKVRERPKSPQLNMWTILSLE